MNRRFFISASFFSLSTFSSLCLAIKPVLPDNKESLKKLIDTLIPEDSTPSGSQLNVHIDLLKHWELASFTRKVLNNINHLSIKIFHKPFPALSQAETTSLIDKSFDTPRTHSLMIVFYQQCLELYYSKPESWQQSPIKTPPQPLGFNI